MHFVKREKALNTVRMTIENYVYGIESAPKQKQFYEFLSTQLTGLFQSNPYFCVKFGLFYVC